MHHTESAISRLLASTILLATTLVFVVSLYSQVANHQAASDIAAYQQPSTTWLQLAHASDSDETFDPSAMTIAVPVSEDA